MASKNPVTTLPLNKLIVYIQKRDRISSLAKLRDRAVERGVNECSPSQFNRLVHYPMNVYPTPEVIETVAAALGLTYNQVLDACTRQMKRPQVWRLGTNGPAVITDEELTQEQAEEYGRRVQQAARRKSHRE